jgi:two-component system chemotaxis response regulator CheY
MRILVVDDDANVRSSIRRTLMRKPGAEVIEASDGMSALQILLSQRCDLVMLDVRMPVMDGIQTLRAIRRSPTHGNVPVVMLTGTADEALVLQAIKLGVIEYLVKPVAPTLLYDRVAKILQPHDPVPDADC